jgi:DNA-binding CsgD family transcriptional regulator
MLTTLGLTTTQERIYLDLIAASRLTVDQITARIGDDAGDEVREALQVLERHGLIQVTDGHVEAAPPDLAIDSLLLERMHHLQRARTDLRKWAEQHRPVRPAEEAVRVVVGAAAITQTFDRFQRAAREEVIGFDRPPYTSDHFLNPTELDMLGRGVTFRIVYDRRALEREHAAADIGRFVAAGEQSRVATDVPGKLAVADRRIALLSFPGPADQAEPWAFVVQGSAWVDVLVALFTEVWERASPLRLAPATDVVADLDRWSVPTPTDKRMLSLVMTGLPDKAVASQLGISQRTVQRRLRQLMDITGSSTRMQLGWYIAQNSWL